MIVITIAFVSGIPAAHMPESLNVEMCHACHAQVSFVSVVCRSSDLSIHVQTILLHKRIASAFSRSHDSSSNDRFSPHAGISRMENNTLELQLLSESCRALAISNVQTAILRWIPSVSGILTRFPCSANKNACPRGFRRLDGKSCLPRLLGSRICHKSHAIQLSARPLFDRRLAFFLYFST